MLTTLASYSLLTRDLTRTLKITADNPLVARETAYYREAITKVKSIDDFLADTRLFTYAMKASGLGDMAYAKAFMRQVLEEGIDDPSSFANSLADRRYREFAKVFNFARYGATTTAFDRTQQGIVDKYIRQSLEEDAGQSNEGVRLALYFARRAEKIENAYDVLADRALLTVVQTALGVSPATASFDIDKQAGHLSERLDFEDFQDPGKVRAFLQRFTTLWDANNPQSPPQVPAILMSQPLEFGINANLLASLQTLNTRSR